MDSSRVSFNASVSARPDVAVATSAPRVTPLPTRAPFKEVLSQSLVRGAETVMRVLPGAPLMAVAMRGVPGQGAALGIPLGGTGMSVRSGGSPEGPVAGGLGGTLPSSSSVVPGLSGLAAPSSASATGTGSAVDSTSGAASGNGVNLEASLAQSQEMNLYYLQVQEMANAQNRSFTALSNVLKTEHETVKTAIGNIR